LAALAKGVPRAKVKNKDAQIPRVIFAFAIFNTIISISFVEFILIQHFRLNPQSFELFRAKPESSIRLSALHTLRERRTQLLYNCLALVSLNFSAFLTCQK
jgi:hypothetical protein